MKNVRELKKNWTLNQEAFDKLLLVFGLFAEDSAIEYENIRAKLRRFFMFNGFANAEEHTDKVIDVVARKISEDNLELDENYGRYFSRIAQNYAKDFWKSAENKVESFDELSPKKEPSVNPLETEKFEKESKLDCMQECLAALPKDDAHLIEQYYSGKNGRDKLILGLGITKNLLRVRILRLKKRLENCIVECVKKIAV